MKPEFFNRLNIIGAVIFLSAFAGILFFADPFKSGAVIVFLLLFSLFGLVITFLNLVNIIFKMPFWCRLLIGATIIAIPILQKYF